MLPASPFISQKQPPKRKTSPSAKKTRLPNGITVEFIDSSYKVAKGRTSGFFKTRQGADINAFSGKEADAILGTKKVVAKPEEAKPEIGKGKLFWPAMPYFDDNYLWLGEFKFSERILRFSPQP